PAQPALRSGAASHERAGRPGHRIPAAGRERAAHAGRHLAIPRRLAAVLHSRQSKLSDGRHRLHRRTPSLGVLRRSAGTTLSGTGSGLDPPPRAGLGMKRFAAIVALLLPVAPVDAAEWVRV